MDWLSQGGDYQFITSQNTDCFMYSVCGIIMCPESDQDDPMRRIFVSEKKHQLGTLTKLCLTTWFDMFSETGNQEATSPKRNHAKPGRQRRLETAHCFFLNLTGSNCNSLPPQ